MKKKLLVRPGVLRVRVYPRMEAAVERGLLYGLRRAEKYATKRQPMREQIIEHCQREIMTAIAEDFDFDDDDND